MNTNEKIIGPNFSTGIKYEYSSFAKTYGLSITSPKFTSFRYPLQISESLHMVNKFIVIQVFHKIGDNFTIALHLRNTENAQIKFVISTTPRSISKINSKTVIQIIEIPPNKWVNICFDLDFVVSKNWPDNSFSSLTHIEVTPSCLLRWMFSSTIPLKQESCGKDLPSFAGFNGLDSQTILLSEKVTSRISKIPVRKKTPNTPTRSRPSKPIPIIIPEEEDSLDEKVFSSEPPSPIKPDIQMTEEEELELVFIDAIGCYYCPSNQQYYHIEED